MPKAPKSLKASELQYQIYALIDPRDKCIRYVGLSADVNYRYFQHLHPDTRHQGKQEMAWVKELQRLGLSPILQVLETVDDNTYLAACKRKHLIPTENMYQFSKLLENMPASLSELSRIANVHERSIMRMRDGNRVQRSTVNKVLRALSQLYGQTFTLDNVTGINVQ